MSKPFWPALVLFLLFGVPASGVCLHVREQGKIIRQDEINWYEVTKFRSDVHELARCAITMPILKELQRRIAEELQARGQAVDSRGIRFHQDWQVDHLKDLHEEVTRLIQKKSSRQEEETLRQTGK